MRASASWQARSKRAATVDLPRRDELLKEALDGYRNADATTSPGRFGAENALQLALIVGGDYADWANTHLAADVEPAAPLDDSAQESRGRVDQRRMNAGDFWGRSDIADRALTRLIAAADEPARQAATDKVLAGYERAFASRSTWAERQTVIDHLRDLLDLIPATDARRPHLQRAVDALQQWEETNVERARRRRRRPLRLQLRPRRHAFTRWPVACRSRPSRPVAGTAC